MSAQVPCAPTRTGKPTVAATHPETIATTVSHIWDRAISHADRKGGGSNFKLALPLKERSNAAFCDARAGYVLGYVLQNAPELPAYIEIKTPPSVSRSARDVKA